MKCSIEVSVSGNDKRWPQVLSSAGIDNISIDLNTFIDPNMMFEQTRQIPEKIKGAIPGYRWRQKIYRKTEKFFHLCAQYGIRTAIKRAGSHLVNHKDRNQLACSSLMTAVEPLSDLFAQKGLQTDLMHAPYPPLEKYDVDLSRQLLKLTRESIYICAGIGCTNLVVQPLFAGIAKGEEWEANRRFFLELLPIASKLNVKLLLENQVRIFNGRIVRGWLSDPSEAVQCIDYLNNEAQGEYFGLCLNMDSCLQCRQDIREYIQHVGSRLKAVWSNFTFGVRFNYRGLILALRKINFNGVLVCDVKYVLSGVPDSIQLDLLNAIAQTLLYLRMQIELEMKLRKYPRLVLFGTGLMFQNYMRNYGQIYPPLYACDNSSEKWGTEICGVKIFSPQKLLDLADDCGVFICNRFYSEVERQLAKMGVKHIERFNDEVLSI